MSKRESKKDHILCSGLEVMKAYGYNGTSVKDIVDAASVPKGSFYNYFDSKESFAIEALEKVASETYQASQDTLGNHSKSPKQRILDYFNQNADYACGCGYKVGCFLGNMCQEMSDSNETIRVKVRQILKRKTALISEVLAEMKAQRELSEETDPDILAEFLFNAWEGALMRMKASKCRDPLDAFLRMLPQVVR